MRKEVPLVSFSVESDSQKDGKVCGETHIFCGFPAYLWCCQTLL